MSSIQSGNQSPRVTQLYLDAPTWAGDPAPGVLVSTASVSGSIVQPYAGQLGGILAINANEAATKWKNSTNTVQLQAGLYQYVQFYASSTGSNARGQIVFWKTPGSYIVTPDAAASDSGEIAGITLGAPSKGNYWFIQIAGMAATLFSASLTNGSPAIGDSIIQDGTPANTAQDPTQTTAVTYALTKSFIGTAVAAPVGGAISLVWLRNLAQQF